METSSQPSTLRPTSSWGYQDTLQLNWLRNASDIDDKDALTPAAVHQATWSTLPRGLVRQLTFEASCFEPPKTQALSWPIGEMAAALAAHTPGRARRQIKAAIERVPFHSLWRQAQYMRPGAAVVYGQLGQDLVRSCNQALGQYATAECLGRHLRIGYKEVSSQLARVGIELRLVGQEYNMAFFVASGRLEGARLQEAQACLEATVWAATHSFLDQTAQENPQYTEATAKVKASLSPLLPLINLGVYSYHPHAGLPPSQSMARAAVGAASAAKVARTLGVGAQLASASEVMSCLNAYRDLLRRLVGTSFEGTQLVIAANQADRSQGRLMLSPKALGRLRAGTITGPIAQRLSEAVSLLNCLDWVQQGEFVRIPQWTKQAHHGWKARQWVDKKHIRPHQATQIREHCLAHIPYLSLAEALCHGPATLVWMDMKKLAVRCHILREAEAFSLLARQDAGNTIEMEDVIDSMIAVDTRVQALRSVLSRTQDVAKAFFAARQLPVQTWLHVGGDDAAMLLRLHDRPLSRELATQMSQALVTQCDKLRVGHVSVKQGANLAEHMCQLDRILSRTKID